MPDAEPPTGAKPPTLRDRIGKPLPKRFYSAVTVGIGPDGYQILLDGRAAKTPRKADIVAVDERVAQALADEWAAQRDVIAPATMPLTTLVCTALDAVAGQEASVRAEIAAYAASDLLCYRCEIPLGLAAAQARSWDPVLAWAEARLGTPFTTAVGLIHVAQPAAVQSGMARALADIAALPLAAVHVLTTITGSAVLALAVQLRHLDLDAAWTAAHVDEDWQIAQWGEDDEARLRRERRLRDARAAAFILMHA
jgi:chaperone required for assembly of F1-ATPase